MSEATTVPLSLVISIGGSLLATFVAALLFLAKRNYGTDHKILLDAIKLLTERVMKNEAIAEDARKDRDAIRERLHADELATLSLQGEVNVVKNNHDQLASDVEEIKRTMVTRDLFDASVQHLRSQLSLILQQLQRYPSSRMPAQVAPSDPPMRR